MPRRAAALVFFLPGTAWGWRCSSCGQPSCDYVCVHGECVNNQCTCAATFARKGGHACEQCAVGYSGYPNCMVDPPGAGTPSPLPPGPPPAPSKYKKCGQQCGYSLGPCPPHDGDGGCTTCSRFANHSGPFCMTKEMSCCVTSPTYTCDYPTDTPRVPQHLMIGDSITDGQFPYVRAMLQNVTDSHLIPINGGPTGEGVSCVGVWAKDPARWDVVSYNFGAWNIGPGDCNLSTDASGRYLDAKLQSYIDDLGNITRQLQRTKAASSGRLVFVLTTPSPQVAECCDDPATRTPGTFGTHTCSKRTAVFNAAARKLLEPMKVAIMDLTPWIAKRCPIPYGYNCSIQTMRPGDPCQVHFDHTGGWEYVAEGYAAYIHQLMA